MRLILQRQYSQGRIGAVTLQRLERVANPDLPQPMQWVCTLGLPSLERCNRLPGDASVTGSMIGGRDKEKLWMGTSLLCSTAWLWDGHRLGHSFERESGASLSKESQ